MCGGFSLYNPPPLIAQRFSLDQAPELIPRYNIALGQAITIIRQSAEGKRESALVRWGLIPAWSTGQQSTP